MRPPIDPTAIRAHVARVVGEADEVLISMIIRSRERGEDRGYLVSLLAVLVGKRQAAELTFDGSHRNKNEREVWPFTEQGVPLPTNLSATLNYNHALFGLAARGIELKPCADPGKGIGAFATRTLRRGALVGIYYGEKLTYREFLARHAVPRDENGVHTESDWAWRRGGGAGSVDALVDRATAVERKKRLDALPEGQRPLGGANNSAAYVFRLPSSCHDTLSNGERVHCIDAEDPNKSSWCRYINHAAKGSPACNTEPKISAEGVIWFVISAEVVQPGEELCFDYGVEVDAGFVAAPTADAAVPSAEKRNGVPAATPPPMTPRTPSSSSNSCPPLMYPEKFELALQYGEGPLTSNKGLSDSDRLLLYALSKQATDGRCNEPKPSMWDKVSRAKWNAWKELGNRSQMEAMFMYVSALEEFEPDWWRWPPLGLVEKDVVVDEAMPATKGIVDAVHSTHDARQRRLETFFSAPEGQTHPGAAEQRETYSEVHPPRVPPPLQEATKEYYNVERWDGAETEEEPITPPPGIITTKASPPAAVKMERPLEEEEPVEEAAAVVHAVSPAAESVALAELCLNAAEVAYSRKDTAKAKAKAIDSLRHATEAVERDRSYFAAHVWYGQALQVKAKVVDGGMGQARVCGQMVQAWDTAVELAPSEPLPYHLLGSFAFHVAALPWAASAAMRQLAPGLRKFTSDDALRLLEMSEARQPDPPVACYSITNRSMIGRLLLQKGRAQEARMWLEKAIGLATSGGLKLDDAASEAVSEARKAHQKVLLKLGVRG